MKKTKQTKKYIKVRDDTVKLPEKEGNGILKFNVTTDEKGKITRYSLTYINYNIYSKDNGRVLGYDNCHGYHHKHYMGKEEKIDFINFEDIQDRFEKEWGELHEKIKKEKGF